MVAVLLSTGPRHLPWLSATMALQSLHRKSSIALGEPKSSGVRVIGQIGEHEESKPAYDDGHDCVDDEQPPPPGHPIGAVQGIGDGHLKCP